MFAPKPVLAVGARLNPVILCENTAAECLAGALTATGLLAIRGFGRDSGRQNQQQKKLEKEHSEFDRDCDYNLIDNLEIKALS